MRVLARALATALPLAVVVACSTQTQNGENCEPGDFTSVTLDDGGAGFLQCVKDGSAYAPFNGANPNAVRDAAVPDGGDAAALCAPVNGKLPYMCFGCATATDCESGLSCAPFPNKGGNLCTYPCKSATDCPANPNSDGCGNSGFCKPVT
jgi:hypothetical protein